MATANAKAPAKPLTNTAAAAMVYEDMQEVIEVTVKGFCKRFRTDYEETLQRAQLIFVETVEYYAAENGGRSMATWMRYNVWYLLIDQMRHDFTKGRRPATGFAGPAALDTVQARPAYRDVTEDMGPDAAYVARLAIDTPEAIAEEIRERGGKSRNARAVLRKYLLTQGWTSARVNTAFEEIAGGRTIVSVPVGGCAGAAQA